MQKKLLRKIIFTMLLASVLVLIGLEPIRVDANKTDQVENLEVSEAEFKGENLSGKTDTVSITVDSVNVEPGETVNVPVIIANNIGIAGFAFEITVPEGVTLNRVAKGDVLGEDETINFNKNTKRVSWESSEALNVYENGCLLTLNVTVPEKKGSYEVAIGLVSGKPSNLTDENFEAVPVAFVPGKLQVGEPQPSEPALAAHSLALGGQIGVNFYMDLPVLEGVDYSESCMKFTVNGKETTAVYDPENKSKDGKYFKFTCNVNAIQMADEIKAVFSYKQNGEEKKIEETFSAESYIKHIDEHPEKFDEKLVALARAMADYGHYAQLYLSAYRGWKIGTDHVAMDTFFTTTYSEEDLESFKTELVAFVVSKGTNADIEEVKYSLSLESNTSINLYFKPTEGYNGKFSVKLGESEIPAVNQEDSRYRVVLSDIGAPLLGRSYEVNVETDTGTVATTVSAMSYARACLDDPRSAEETSAMAALYRYYKTALAYFTAGGE